MKFYTKFQLPQNLFSNVRKIFTWSSSTTPIFINDNFEGNSFLAQGEYNVITILSILKALTDEQLMLNEFAYLQNKSKTYLRISLILHAIILLPLTLLFALARDVIDIAVKSVVIALNLVLDLTQLAIEAVTLALQFVAFVIEKTIVNPIAFVWNKFFSKANNKEEGPKQSGQKSQNQEIPSATVATAPKQAPALQQATDSQDLEVGTTSKVGLSFN